MTYPSNTTRGANHQLIFSPPLSNSAPIETSDISKTDLFLDSQLRAGGPYLCAIPAVSKEIGPQDLGCARIQESANTLIDGARKYLNEAGIMHMDIDITKRASQSQPEPQSVLTMLIIAKRRSREEEWREAARKISGFLQQEDYGDMCVDILDESLLKPYRSWPITPSDQIFSQWIEILEEAHSMLCAEKVSCISCGKRGRADEKADNPPTLVMFQLATDIFRKYDREMEGVLAILARFGITDTAVHFYKNELWRGPGP